MSVIGRKGWIVVEVIAWSMLLGPFVTILALLYVSTKYDSATAAFVALVISLWMVKVSWQRNS